MNRITLMMLVVCLLAPGSTTSSADDMESSLSFPSCGVVVNRNTSYQFGSFNWVEYIVETQGVFDICGQWLVMAQANVVGVGSSALSASGIMYASARRQIMVPAYNRRYQTDGHHYASGSIPNLSNYGWWSTGNTASFADVVAPATQPDPALDCLDMDGVWRDTWCDFKPTSPLIVDTAGNGYALTSVEDGVRFDLNADGVPEVVAWTQPDSDDAFLAMDRNGNGRIDDGSELFGDKTPAYPNDTAVTTANGFEALKFLETPTYGRSNPDGAIDAQDAAFSRLLLWRDANHNGISEPEELQPVAGSGLLAIATDYKEKRRLDRWGNQFRQRGTVTWQDGHDFIYDVWLRWRD